MNLVYKYNFNGIIASELFIFAINTKIFEIIYRKAINEI